MRHQLAYLGVAYTVIWAGIAGYLVHLGRRQRAVERRLNELQGQGALLKEEWGIGSEVLVIDGIALRDFDFIDLGRIRMPSHTVPVTIKSLVFSQDPRVPHRHAHHRQHDH